MFKKPEINVIELKRCKLFENIQLQKDIIAKNNFHETKAPLAKVTAKGDHCKINQLDKSFKNKIDLSIDIWNKGEEIENVLQQPLELKIKAEKSLVISQNAFKMALMHHCYYDITEKKNDVYIITFVPFSTSKKSVLCGIQEFNKIPLLLNSKYKNFYTIRVLFRKNMTEKEYIAGDADKKFGYQYMKLRRYLFNVIQKDLEENEYSILSEEELLNPKVEFLTKELPRIKFKFMDLVE